MLDVEISKAKNSIKKITGKTTAKVKAASYEQKLQVAYCKLGEYVYNNDLISENCEDETITSLVAEIKEIKENITSQNDAYNELSGKTRCEVCGEYSANNVPFCAYCGSAKPMAEECSCNGDCNCDECEKNADSEDAEDDASEEPVVEENGKE